MEKKVFSNRGIALILKEAAAALIVKGEDPFRIKAYENAAESIERSPIDVYDLWEDGRLEDLPGVGQAIARYLNELIRTGKSKHFEKMAKNLPRGMFEFLSIPGVGAKTACKLAKNLGINRRHGAVGRLREAIRDGRAIKIPGFGEERILRIEKGISELLKRGNKMLLSEATALAEKVINYLKTEPAVVKVEALGSLRRRGPMIGDIDLGVATYQPRKVADHFTRYSQWNEVLASGEKTARAIHRGGRQVDLKIELPSQFGSLLQHFTGSKSHNVALREYALSRGMSLSEHGIRLLNKQKDGSFRTFRTEEEFYRALGLAWIPPELRENQGEIEAARLGKLPKLVKIEDLRGDFHIHSDIDIEVGHDLGRSSLEEICRKSISLGYEYIAISDHNPSTSRHNSSEIITLIKERNNIIDQFMSSRGKNMKIKMIRSLEIDIRLDGRLAVPDEGIELLDLAIVSIHSGFRGSRLSQTKRVLKALNHPKIKILGHPTGRMLGAREGIDLDWDKIFDFCLKNNIWLEVNSSEARLDLPEALVKEAVDNGIKIAIGSDSHDVSQMGSAKLGVDVARRGWAESEDVVNTMGYNKVVELLKQ